MGTPGRLGRAELLVVRPLLLALNHGESISVAKKAQRRVPARHNGTA